MPLKQWLLNKLRKVAAWFWHLHMKDSSEASEGTYNKAEMYGISEIEWKCKL